MTSRDSRSSNAAKARYTSVSATDTRHRLLRYFTSRARWLAAASLAGLATPWLSGLLAGSFGTIAWLVDLASHWQWLYLAILVSACLVLIREDRRWGLALLAVPLPWMTATESAPPSEFEPRIPVLTVASANVHFENSDAPPLARWLLEASPDVVVLHEVSPAYAEQLQVYRQYPFKHLAPANDPFGVAILSRFPLTNVETVAGEDGIPHVKAVLDWNGHLTTLIAWHPMPPLSPRDHHARNTHLSALAEAAHQEGKPTILAGDLNATPWSNAFNGIGEMGLRRATGLLPTWPATGLGWLGIPIDHVLVSAHWQVVGRSKGPDIGSDHFPVVARITLTRDTLRIPVK